MLLAPTFISFIPSGYTPDMVPSDDTGSDPSTLLGWLMPSILQPHLLFVMSHLTSILYSVSSEIIGIERYVFDPSL